MVQFMPQHACNLRLRLSTPNATAPHTHQQQRQVENNFEAVGLESAAFFRPSTLIGNANTPSVAASIHKMVSWALPIKYKEIHIEDVGKAMVRAAVVSLDNKGPAVARYEGASLFGLLEDKPAAAAPGSSS